MLKRLFDLSAALIGLVLLSPILLGIAALIKLTSQGPAFYRGVRVGRHGRPFRIMKFRSMVAHAEEMGSSSTAADDNRLTQLGKFLRRYKLDELPQLMNVLVGDMSFVGPRPQVPWAVARYSHTERMLLGVRPGITDYASIRFRNEAQILAGSHDPDRAYMEKIAPEKIRLALYYVHHQSFWLDLRIIATTIWALLGGKVTLPELAESRVPQEFMLR